MVIADGAPTSYVRIGFEQMLNLTSQLNIKLAMVDIGDLLKWNNRLKRLVTICFTNIGHTGMAQERM